MITELSFSGELSFKKSHLKIFLQDLSLCVDPNYITFECLIMRAHVHMHCSVSSNSDTIECTDIISSAS